MAPGCFGIGVPTLASYSLPAARAEGIFFQDGIPEPGSWVRASFKTLGQCVMAELSGTERGFRAGLMQISFSWLEKATGSRDEVWWAEAATPCLVLVMPRRVREDGNSKA